MRPDTAKFTEFLNQVGERFGFDDLAEMELTDEDIVSEPGDVFFLDVVREETGEAFRFFLFHKSPNLNSDAEEFFDRYRDFEIENEDEHEGSVILWKGVEDENFRYMFRTDSGEIGLFFSEFSVDDDEDFEDEDDDDEDDDEEEMLDEEDDKEEKK